MTKSEFENLEIGDTLFFQPWDKFIGDPTGLYDRHKGVMYFVSNGYYFTEEEVEMINDLGGAKFVGRDEDPRQRKEILTILLPEYPPRVCSEFGHSNHKVRLHYAQLIAAEPMRGVDNVIDSEEYKQLFGS